MTEKLSFIQNEMFNIAKIIHKICEDNNIRYAICGGTLIGAVRHKGFIPWDDDFDIIMPREDFNKFLDVWRDFSQYKISKNGDKDYYKVSTPAKIHNSNTRVVEFGEVENGIGENFITQGVFVDIFPIDLYPDNFIGKLINKYLGKLNMKKAESQFSMNLRPRFTRLVIHAFKYIPKKIIDMLIDYGIKYIYTHSNKNIKVGYGVETAINNLWVDPKVIFPFKKNMLINDFYFYAPANSDEYLKHRFGDYMKLPPIELRKAHIDKLFINGQEII